ncbi:hypothetical protein ACEWY4_003876 [Coilia grayii]|uniref:MAM domain-containing protein n=1 Tax=Coilia grayii TaxID=363190 RepID=A0ABD1KK64_9TELE
MDDVGDEDPENHSDADSDTETGVSTGVQTETRGLNVKLLHADGAEELLWAQLGAHGNKWHEGLCLVSSPLNSYQLVVEAQRLAFDGLVAIDDITFVPGLCSLASMCSFEGQDCGYSSSGAGLWVHQRAGAGNGPETDHTLETKNGCYMVVNTGADVFPQGRVAILTSPLHTGITRMQCVHFWYHIRGQDSGSLSVYVKHGSEKREKVFTSDISQEDTWHHGHANISSSGNFQMEFEVTGAGGDGTFIAIDDVIFSVQSCAAKGAVCDLEHGLCDWSNTQNSSRDQLDWEVTTASQESRLPTPQEDHSLKTDKGHFLFLPSTPRTPASSKAWLSSPHLPPTHLSCLRFWLYKHGSFGKLRVLRLAFELEHELFTAVEGESSDWARHDINITSQEEFQIIFEGITGSEGVLALDDIELREGMSCSEIITPPPTASPPSNAGGIAASIIVAMMLLGSFVAILYFYLRVRQRIKAGLDGPSDVTYEQDSRQGHESASQSQIYVYDIGPGNEMYAEQTAGIPRVFHLSNFLWAALTASDSPPCRPRIVNTSTVRACWGDGPRRTHLSSVCDDSPRARLRLDAIPEGSGKAQKTCCTNVVFQFSSVPRYLAGEQPACKDRTREGLEEEWSHREEGMKNRFG